MELLIVSDSHGHAERLTEALQRQIKRPDAICFLGDGLRDTEVWESVGIPVYTVRGNCDWSGFYRDEPTERFLYLEGHKLMLTHGHVYDVKSGYGRLEAYARENGADIVLFGHTHVPVELSLPPKNEERRLYLFNPGSIACDDGDGYPFGTLTLQGKNVLFSHGRI